MPARLRRQSITHLCPSVFICGCYLRFGYQPAAASQRAIVASRSGGSGTA